MSDRLSWWPIGSPARKAMGSRPIAPGARGKRSPPAGFVSMPPASSSTVVHEGERPRRDIAQRERGRARAPQPVALEPARDEGRNAARIRRADGEQRARAQRSGLDAKRSAIEPGPFPKIAGEELARERIVDDARQREPVAQHADGDGEAGDAATEVIGAVDRVDDPDVAAGRQGLPPAALLAQHHVLGKSGADLAGKKIFDGEIGVGDHGVVVLPGHPRALEIAHQRLARAEREGHRRLEARIRQYAGRHARLPAPPVRPRSAGRGGGRPACPPRSRPGRTARPARPA